MSLSAMVWALKRARVGDPAAKLVLVGLSEHADDDGRNAWPSQKLLAEYAETSDRTVRRKLQYLEEVGLIRRGDQRLVDHLPPSKRPIVWDLGYASAANYDEDDTPAETPQKWADTVSGQVTGQIVRPDTGGKSDRTLLSDKPSLEPLGKESGNSHVGAVDNFSPPKSENEENRLRPDRCPRHQTDTDPPACGGCRDARLAAEGAAARAKAERDELARAKSAAARRDLLAAIRRCRMCDTDGQLRGHPCNHDPHTIEAAHRGAAEARALLADAKNTRPALTVPDNAWRNPTGDTPA